MIDLKKVRGRLDGYDLNNIKIGVVASHSALDVCDGAVDEGFPSLAVCEKGREKTYTKYFKTEKDSEGNRIKGVVDETWV
ncbi:MAG: DUF1246 domain-containing protein, partial [Thermoplasmatota archaeon]